MSYFEEEKEEIRALVDLFDTIKGINKSCSLDQAVDIMDMYLRTGDEKYLTKEDNIRDNVVKSNIRETFYPIYEEGYEHLSDYIEDMIPKKSKTK